MNGETLRGILAISDLCLALEEQRVRQASGDECWPLATQNLVDCNQDGGGAVSMKD